MEWFIYSISSVVLFSGMTALYKLPAHKNQSRLAATFWMMAFVFLFALIVFHQFILKVDEQILFFAFLWGASFGVLTSIQMYLLKNIEINTLFPINTMTSLIIAIFFGLFIFADKISMLQGLGIILATTAVYLFLFNKKKIKLPKNTIKIGIAMVALSVFTKVIQKTAVDAVPDIRILIIYQFLFAALVVMIFFFAYHKKSWRTKLLSSSAKSGLLIAIPAFAGNWALMTALSKGPFTLITALHSLYIFGGSIFGYLFYREDLTKKKLVLLGVAILAIIFIRLG